MTHLLCCDFDGTLVDSIANLKQAYHHFLRQFGCSGSEEEFERCNGLPLAEIMELLKQHHSLVPSCQTLLSTFEEIIDIHYPTSPPRQGCKEVLSKAKERGWNIAIVSSSKADWIASWLYKNNLQSYVDLIIGREQVKKHKPNPEPYEKALSHFHVPPKNAIAVEDSLIGLTSSLQAGIPSFFLGEKPTLSTQTPLYPIDSLDQILPQLIAKSEIRELLTPKGASFQV